MNIEKSTINTAARLMSEAYNAATSQRHHENEIRFSFYNHASLVKAIKEERARDLGAVGKVGENKPIMIIASGPSLNEALPLLKDWPHPIMVSTSHAATCIYHGREPEYIIALDPDSYPDELAVDTWEGRKSILVLQPGVNPELIDFWKGPMLLFRKLQPQTPFYAGPQTIGYSTMGDKEGTRWSGKNVIPLIACQIPMLGCVLAAQICIAKQLGFNRIYMVGADFTATRFNGWHYRNGAWIENPGESIESILKRWENIEMPLTTGYKIIQLEDGTYTTPMSIFYQHQCVTAWRITECDVVNCAPKSNLKIMPMADIEEVIRKKGEDIKGFSKPQIIETAEQYLAMQNVYFFNIGKGIMPREFKDPLTEIPRSLREIKIILEQQGKGAELDIEANMKRIRKLWENISSTDFTEDTHKRGFEDGAKAVEKIALKTIDDVLKEKK